MVRPYEKLRYLGPSFPSPDWEPEKWCEDAPYEKLLADS